VSDPKKRHKEKRARQRRKLLALNPIDSHVAEIPFGPFKNVPVKLIHPAGFDCPLCRQPVKRFGLQTPIVPRIMIHACECGPGVATWEDEQNPTIKTWPDTIQLARLTDAGIVIFNGGKETPANFQGTN
jgi:hypothetical protein